MKYLWVKLCNDQDLLQNNVKGTSMGEEKEQIRLTKGLLQLLKVVTGIWGFILLFHFYGYVYISTENQNAKDELAKKVLQVKNKYCISCAF